MNGYYMVFGPHQWGGGDTLDAAKARFRREGGSLREPYFALRFEKDQEVIVRWDGAVAWAGPDPDVVVDKRADRSKPIITRSSPDSQTG